MSLRWPGSRGIRLVRTGSLNAIRKEAGVMGRPPNCSGGPVRGNASGGGPICMQDYAALFCSHSRGRDTRLVPLMNGGLMRLIGSVCAAVVIVVVATSPAVAAI